MTSELSQRLLQGDKRALSRVLSLVENGYPEGRQVLRETFSQSGRAHTIGITGPTGSGKSTLVSGLAREFRKRGRTVGIVAIDPTSPFSQGALLGDRIRMQDLTGDPGVFIRSMATRGALGGLAPASNDVVTIMDAADKEVILVETVGAGQDEVEIADTADTTVVISMPGTGDDIQAIKAGILEIADILVVNKSDRPGADAIAKQLHTYMTLNSSEGWEIPIIMTAAHRSEGIPGLADAIQEHYHYLKESGRLEELRRHRARRYILSLAQRHLLNRVLVAAEGSGGLDALVEAVARREIDPHTGAERLVEAAYGPNQPGTQ
ncbi:MAG: methylmalonyl Co-A mutase-associated GTPase MeaB [Dehalococcoidia bacterium]